MSILRIRVKRPIPGFFVGQIVNAQADAVGTPLEEMWRRRLKDAKIDDCCEIVPDPAPTPEKKTPRRRPYRKPAAWEAAEE